MSAVLIAVLAFFAYLLAYHSYGRRLATRLLGLDAARPTPAQTKRDGVDYVPSNRFVLFGHHFATIAGLGPILGPAIAVIWGWLPAVLWIFAHWVRTDLGNRSERIQRGNGLYSPCLRANITSAPTCPGRVFHSR